MSRSLISPEQPTLSGSPKAAESLEELDVVIDAFVFQEDDGGLIPCESEWRVLDCVEAEPPFRIVPASHAGDPADEELL